MLLASLIIVKEPFVLSTYFIVFCKLICCSTRQLIVKGFVELGASLVDVPVKTRLVHSYFLPVGEFCSKSCLITFESFLLLFVSIS